MSHQITLKSFDSLIRERGIICHLSLQFGTLFSLAYEHPEGKDYLTYSGIYRPKCNVCYRAGAQ